MCDAMSMYTGLECKFLGYLHFLQLIPPYCKAELPQRDVEYHASILTPDAVACILDHLTGIYPDMLVPVFYRWFS